jgi:hypothetical protein
VHQEHPYLLHKHIAYTAPIRYKKWYYWIRKQWIFAMQALLVTKIFSTYFLGYNSMFSQVTTSLGK